MPGHAKPVWSCLPKGQRIFVRQGMLDLPASGCVNDDEKSNFPILGQQLIIIVTGEFIPEKLKKSGVGERHFFWSGNGLAKSAVADWQRSLASLFKLAGVKGHAHRFRDIFSLNLLKSGVGLETVSMLLGHSPLRVTEKHCAPWVQSRQAALEEVVKLTW